MDIPEDGIDYEIMITESISFAEDLRSALVAKGKKIEKRWSFWTHDIAIATHVTRKKLPFMDRSQIEDVTDRYLKFNFRHQYVDRLLVDILTALEIYGFAGEVVDEPKWHNIFGTSRLRGMHIIPKTILTILIEGLLLGGLASLFIWIGSFGGLLQPWAIGLAVVLVGLYALEVLMIIIKLPFAWRSQIKARKKVGDILGSMVKVYAELDSSGFISAKHIYNQLESSGNIGIVWPAQLFVLLDDIMERGGKF